MGDANPIRNLEDYYKPSHGGYRNTIELPEGNNVVPLRSDTIRLVKNGCSFHRLRSEDPNQNLKDFLELLDSLDLDGANRERKCLRLFQLSLRDQASNWNDRKTPQRYPVVPTTSRRISLRSMDSFQGLTLKSPSTWHRPLAQNVSSTSDRHLIELENQVQCLMEAYIAPMQHTKVKNITSSCEIYSGPHETQYRMENPEQAFVEYASSTDEAELEGLVSNFMASQDDRLSKFEADFKQQQSEMTNKIDTVLKAITDRIARALPNNTVKNPKLNVNSTSLVLSARSYPTEDP
ncbi:hypothetical protein Tco_1385497 [Tanacetum coccineum]